MRLGQLAKAVAELEELREEFAACGNELDVLRCDWSLGRVLLERGEASAAERQLRRARDRFVDLAIPYDAAQANLDLAVALLEQGKLTELKERLAEAIPVFQALGIPRETIAALGFLKQATELEKVTVGLIRATARFVESARRDPALRFRSDELTEAP